jgi:hypothetical protein
MNAQLIHVLLIEDNLGDVRLLQETLKTVTSIQIQLTQVEQLREALVQLTRNQFDLVLLDLSLPDSQGLEAFSRLHQQMPTLPIIVLTGLDDETMAIRSIQEGAQDYLVKGQVSGDLLIRSMRYAIGRQQSENDLRRMSHALESAVEGIAQLDRQGRYIYVNQAYANMLGYQPDEMIGMVWISTIHPDDLDTVQAAYQRLVTDGKVELEALAVRKDGSQFDKQVVMVKVYDPLHAAGHYCFMKDISDRREVERMKDEFISVVSHELRTPLTSISGALDLLAAGVLQTQPEDAQRMLAIAANNTDRLVRLINDILDVERIKSGKVILMKQVCQVATLMTQAVEVVQNLADQAGITLAIEPLSVRVWADPDRLIQVFTNLLSNAIKFSPPGSTVSVSAALQELYQGNTADGECRLPSQEVWLQVQDQVRGIPPEQLESIFERFRQVDASDSRQRGGTGLGLAICKSIVQQHEGRIWAESQLGQGSTFFVVLPALWNAASESSHSADYANKTHSDY